MLRRWLPARTRALITRTVGRRCSPGSRCQLLARTLIERIERALAAPPPDVTADGATRLSEAEVRGCLRLVDSDQMMREHATRALALATLQEALIQSQFERTATHERDAMGAVARELEYLETRLYAAPFASCTDAPEDEDARRALLLHLGRGIELLQRVATQGA